VPAANSVTWAGRPAGDGLAGQAGRRDDPDGRYVVMLEPPLPPGLPPAVGFAPMWFVASFARKTADDRHERRAPRRRSWQRPRAGFDGLVAIAPVPGDGFPSRQFASIASGIPFAIALPSMSGSSRAECGTTAPEAVPRRVLPPASRSGGLQL